MADHLTPDQLSRYLKRMLAPDEVVLAEGHLASCEQCREQASDGFGIHTAYAFLRRDIHDARLQVSHLTYEELEKYVDQKIDAVDREIADSHLEVCLTCSGELRDLQNVRDSLAARSVDSEDHVVYKIATQAHATGDANQDFSHSEVRQNLWIKARRWFGRPAYRAGAAAAVAAVIAVSVFVPFHWSTKLQPEPTTQSAPLVAPSPTGSAAPDAQSKRPTLNTPKELASLIGKTETLLGTSVSHDSFELIEPVGTFVEDVRPSFHWRSLVGTKSYKISIFDAALSEIVTSGALSGTDWKSSVALKRGVIYLWQVTATKKGQEVVSPAPPAAEAKFEVLKLSDADRLEQMKHDAHGSHFELGRAYSDVGVIDRAEQEFRQVPASDPNYQWAQEFTSQLRALRHRELPKP